MAAHGESDTDSSENSDVNSVDSDFDIVFDSEVLAGYTCEPYATDCDDSDSDSSLMVEECPPAIPENMDWCTCGMCVLMEKAIECNCCASGDDIHQKVRDKISALQAKEKREDLCITQFQAFQDVCLNVNVLQVAYYNYKQQHGRLPVKLFKRYRYTAYRQFVRMCWVYLGKDIRVPLPACVVTAVRKAFPNPLEEAEDYVGFKEVEQDLLPLD